MQISIFRRNVFSEKDWWIALPVTALWLLALATTVLAGNKYVLYSFAALTILLLPAVFYWGLALYTVPAPGIVLMFNASSAHIRMLPGQWVSYLALALWIAAVVSIFRTHSKESDRSARRSTMRKVLSGTALTVLGVLMSLALLASVVTFLFGLPFATRSFDQALWLKSSQNREMDNPRGNMAADLIQNHLSKGMTRGEVHRLLGEPNADFINKSNQESYYLGMHGAFRMDPQTLDIDYRSGRVSNAYVTEH